MTAPWLSIIGIGEDGAEALAPAARALIAHATRRRAASGDD
jgi:precorrin-6Y C5,15-methyltransferase (decarboxylating)